MIMSTIKFNGGYEQTVVCTSCYVTNTKMKHQNQQEVIIITLASRHLLSRHHCISQWKTQASPIHTYLEQNLIQGISIYQNVTSTDEIMGKMLT